MNVRELVSNVQTARRGRRTATERRWEEFVLAALADAIDPDEFIAFVLDNDLDAEQFALEIEIRLQRPAWEAVINDLPNRELAVGRARSEQLAERTAPAQPHSPHLVSLSEKPTPPTHGSAWGKVTVAGGKISVTGWGKIIVAIQMV